VVVTLFVAVSITETFPVSLPKFAFTTYTFVPSGLTATPLGPYNPKDILAVTLFVAVSIAETLLLFWFATYTFAPLGVTATPKGCDPTGTVAVTFFVAMSIIETVLLTEFVIYANGAAPAILISIKIIALTLRISNKIYIYLSCIFSKFKCTKLD
jgi:hypothetical protein